MESICRATLLENGAGDAAHNASNINGNNKARPVGLFGRPSERDRMRMNSKFGGKGSRLGRISLAEPAPVLEARYLADYPPN